MESNDNGTLPEVQIRKLHISATGTSLRKPRQENSRDSDELSEKRALWLTTRS